MTDKSPTSRQIGSVLAKLQLFVDDVFEFGFKKLKVFGTKNVAPKNPETIKEKAADFAQKSAGFVGDVGSSYYEEYQKLKAEKQARNSKK